jgi:hypothetical protein
MDLSPSPSNAPIPDPSAATPPSTPIRPGTLWALAIAGALLSGAVADGLYEVMPTIFIPPPHMVSMMGQRVNQPLLPDVIVADRKNAMVTFAIAGGLLAMLLGLAGGLARRSIRGALLGGVAGLVLAAGVGVAAAAVAVPIHARQHEKDPDSITKDMTLPLLIHAGTWAALGAAAGAALGLGAGLRGRLPSVILGGLVGGALGAGIYDVTAALIWADGRTYQIYAHKWAPRLYAALLPPLAITFVAVSGVVSPARRAKQTPALAPSPAQKD